MLEFAENLARQAGRITMEYFGRPIEVDLKADESPVTVADRQTEAFIRREIERKFPDHGILGEEEGSTRPEASHQWIVDPIDGTKSFIRGVPLYGVMIALEIEGRSSIGVIHHPPLDLLISAQAGHGTHLNGRPVRVREARSAAETCILSTNFAPFLNERPGFCAALARRFPMQRTWGDCYGYTMVASGQAQAMLDAAMNRWDLAALMPIIEEAGGVLTDLNGVRTNTGKHCVAGTPEVHAQMLELLSHPEPLP